MNPVARYTPSEEWLLHEMASLPVVDAHNHLPLERVRLEEHFDALTFYRQYTRLVMFAAGLSERDFLRMHDPEAGAYDALQITPAAVVGSMGAQLVLPARPTFLGTHTCTDFAWFRWLCRRSSFRGTSPSCSLRQLHCWEWRRC